MFSFRFAFFCVFHWFKENSFGLLLPPPCQFKRVRHHIEKRKFQYRKKWSEAKMAKAHNNNLSASSMALAKAIRTKGKNGESGEQNRKPENHLIVARWQQKNIQTASTDLLFYYFSQLRRFMRWYGAEGYTYRSCAPVFRGQQEAASKCKNHFLLSLFFQWELGAQDLASPFS